MTYAGMLMIYFFKIYYREIRFSGEELGGCEMYEQTHMSSSTLRYLYERGAYKIDSWISYMAVTVNYPKQIVFHTYSLYNIS